MTEQTADQPSSESVENALLAQFGIGPDQLQDEQDEPAEAEATAEPQESDDVEIEWGEGRYRVPKALEEPISKARDYTKKTQELAEQRRLVEQTQQAMKLAQIEQEFQKEAAQDVQGQAWLENYISQLQQSDTRQMTTDEKLDHLFQLQQAERQLSTVKQSLESKKGEYQTKLKSAVEQAKLSAREVLSKQGVSEGAIPAIREYAKTLGFTDAAMDAIEMDARSLTVLNKAREYDALRASKAEAVQKLNPVVKPTSSNPMPAHVKDKLAYNKAMKSAKTSSEKAALIQKRLEAMF